VKPFPTSAHQPPLLHESSATQPVLYTIGAVDFIPLSWWWAWWCPKHVETPINTSYFLHLVGYLFTFMSTKVFLSDLSLSSTVSRTILHGILVPSNQYTTTSYYSLTDTKRCQWCVPSFAYVLHRQHHAFPTIICNKVSQCMRNCIFIHVHQTGMVFPEGIFSKLTVNILL
jgi:hypothetical protein